MAVTRRITRTVTEDFDIGGDGGTSGDEPSRALIDIKPRGTSSEPLADKPSEPARVIAPSPTVDHARFAEELNHYVGQRVWKVVAAVLGLIGTALAMSWLAAERIAKLETRFENAVSRVGELRNEVRELQGRRIGPSSNSQAPANTEPGTQPNTGASSTASPRRGP